jgi:hypothetical protein
MSSLNARGLTTYRSAERRTGSGFLTGGRRAAVTRTARLRVDFF